MTEEPDNLVLQLLRQMRGQLDDMQAGLDDMRGDVREIKTNFATKADLMSLRADVASDLHVQRKELSEQIVGLRRAVIDYHTSVVGHGIIISELEERLRRVEQHLNMPPLRTM
jgi:hypothetical protein